MVVAFITISFTIIKASTSLVIILIGVLLSDVVVGPNEKTFNFSSFVLSIFY
jgi:hypothetical protein